MSSETKPRVLILGGTGFVARHLVKYLIDNNLISKIRVADKQLSKTAYMSDEFLNIYENNPLVEYKQANLSDPQHIKKAFEDSTGPFNFVVNLAAETRYGQEEPTYKQMVYDISVNCAKEALNYISSIEKYIEVSTAQVYDSGSKASKETDKIAPWTLLAKFKAQAEDELKKLSPEFSKKLIILRPAIIYGPADLNGLTPRITCACTYTSTNEKMKLLWSGDLCINTVHVRDVARAIWHLYTNTKTSGPLTFNLCDKNQTDQKKMNEILEKIFGIETGFFGTLLSQAAKLNMKAAADTANENHMLPWSEMTKQSGIKFTPLSPHIDKELLYNNSLSVDGSLIEKETGFHYEYPKMTEELILEQIDYFKKLNLFPNFTKLEKKK
nr:unnamed protein product [Naegleria fowleri]